MDVRAYYGVAMTNNRAAGRPCIWRAQAATELRRVVEDGIQRTSQGRTGMYYDGQVDWGESDWLDGLFQPMSRDSQK